MEDHSLTGDLANATVDDVNFKTASKAFLIVYGTLGAFSILMSLFLSFCVLWAASAVSIHADVSVGARVLVDMVAAWMVVLNLSRIIDTIESGIETYQERYSKQ